jgi:hypothetical protein
MAAAQAEVGLTASVLPQQPYARHIGACDGMEAFAAAGDIFK